MIKIFGIIELESGEFTELLVGTFKYNESISKSMGPYKPIFYKIYCDRYSPTVNGEAFDVYRKDAPYDGEIYIAKEEVFNSYSEAYYSIIRKIF